MQSLRVRQIQTQREGKNKTIVIFDRLTEEEKAIRNGQYEALSLRLDQYEIQKRH